ncbi:methylated-DNA--[protein]-cysteine S-methyltransferase [Acidovorax sp. CCYZU-2555]|uniref:methylated-DNA--[protein]-cysteine S-methyltransferase n=1 Tax=Acidovorax sp. CCYZU-2555 TaxID=2835042 RepID=UPI001BCDF074|nr:methylated-DNA--[protein]-cysteine S-methyltransferase [Acidovorax sp. CCYZU-2555]MBS7780372.1 methylated-DNA--[protein]-cysteine S-methyltransferase [Acidovorax sp. CCYZU-2555]
MSALNFQLEKFSTPIGQMLLVSDEQQQVRAVDWQDYEARMQLLMRRQYKGIAVSLRDAAQASPARRILEAYFAGDLSGIDSIEVALGGTDFQRQVWLGLRGIAAGQVLSYGDFAQRLGRPSASRAVGLANGANPISVVLPCHRVIGRNASLTGYGGGLQRKRWLLEHENAIQPLSQTLPGF